MIVQRTVDWPLAGGNQASAQRLNIGPHGDADARGTIIRAMFDGRRRKMIGALNRREPPPDRRSGDHMPPKS
ncbi:MAG TPA: hypothetical protein VHJ58_04495 [Vicinamibacterales bacterium]|nr:hypothetical protein [Vicinamibacterales bacterium]